MLQSRVFATALTLMLAAPAFGQTGGANLVASKPCKSARPPEVARITITVAAAKQEDAPVEIVGFKLPERVATRHPVAVVKNRSTKPIKHFWIGVIVERADGLTGTAGLEGERSISGSNIMTLSEGEAARHNILSSGHLAHSATTVLSDCLHAAAVVSIVEFEDGTTWSRNVVDDARQLWESSRTAGAASACSHTPGIEKTLQVIGTGYESGNTPTKLGTGQVESYTVSCAIRDVGGKLAALCPF